MYPSQVDKYSRYIRTYSYISIVRGPQVFQVRVPLRARERRAAHRVWRDRRARALRVLPRVLCVLLRYTLTLPQASCLRCLRTLLLQTQYRSSCQASASLRELKRRKGQRSESARTVAHTQCVARARMISRGDRPTQSSCVSNPVLSSIARTKKANFCIIPSG